MPELGVALMSTVKAIVKPELLTWARVSASLDLGAAAKKTGVKHQQIADWEAGKSQPTFIQLRKLSEIYKRPIAVFYLPAPPADKELPPHDFRKLNTESSQRYSPELAYEIRRAHHRRTVALDLYRSLNDSEEPPTFDFEMKLGANPEMVGEQVRAFFGIQVNTQKSWGDVYESWNAWRSSVEAKNILVFQSRDIAIEEMRGFSFSARPFPVIVVNSKDKPVARIFTLIHEFAHIALGEDGICNLSEGKQVAEIYCNAVAGAVLVPAASLMQEPEVVNNAERHWNDELIEALANRYKVSRLVIVRRLESLSLITRSQFQSMHLRFDAQYKKGSDEDSKSFPVAQHTQAINRAGRLFSRLVLSGYKQDKITGVDFADFLSLKLKHLSSFEASLLSK